uniref:Uncharacterized protein n=1 Tax=Meloidogyne enterolobii TaxID=390850 RepID=A0A6V7THR5_MELEN|nr:unnamed protein product [Meloidogyne enterolobii]
MNNQKVFKTFILFLFLLNFTPEVKAPPPGRGGMGTYQVNYQMFPNQTQFNPNNPHPLQLPFYQHTERTGTGVFLPAKPGTGVFLPQAPTKPGTGVPPKRSTNNGKERGGESSTSFGQQVQDSSKMEGIKTQPPRPKHHETKEGNEKGRQYIIAKTSTKF